MEEEGIFVTITIIRQTQFLLLHQQTVYIDINAYGHKRDFCATVCALVCRRGPIFVLVSIFAQVIDTEALLGTRPYCCINQP